MLHQTIACPPACHPATLVNIDRFPDGLPYCAQLLLATHVELQRECRYVADQQRWLLSHVATAIHFEHQITPSAMPLTPAALFKALGEAKIASRNTVTMFLKEMQRYGFCASLTVGDKRKRALRVTTMAEQLICRYFDIHLRALDMIDGGQRQATLEKHPELLSYAQPLFAREIVAQETWYEPPVSIAQLTRSNSGSSILHELALGVPRDLTGAGTQIWVGKIALGALAKRYGLSKTHTAYLLETARLTRSIGWVKEGNHNNYWISPDTVRDYRSWQALKLATIAKAFWEGCILLKVDPA